MPFIPGCLAVDKPHERFEKLVHIVMKPPHEDEEEQIGERRKCDCSEKTESRPASHAISFCNILRSPPPCDLKNVSTHQSCRLGPARLRRSTSPLNTRGKGSRFCGQTLFLACSATKDLVRFTNV